MSTQIEQLKAVIRELIKKELEEVSDDDDEIKLANFDKTLIGKKISNPSSPVYPVLAM